MNSQKAGNDPGNTGRLFYGYIIVAAIFFIMIAIWGSYYSCGVFFKPLLAEFGWTRTTISSAFSLAMLMSGLLSIPMGRLTDQVGTRLVMTLCGFLMGAGMMLMSLVGSVWQIYLFYTVIIGTGMTGSFVPVVSAIVRWFIKRRGFMTGIILAGSGAGALIGPPVANWLISTTDWRQAYIIMGAFTLVFTILLAQLLRRDPSQVGQVPYGADIQHEEINLPSEDYTLAEASGTGQFWLMFLAQMCLAWTIFTTSVHIAPLTSDLGFSASSAAFTLTCFGAGAVMGRIGMGTACDYLGNKRVYLAGSIINALVVFAFIPVKELWSIYLLAVLMGFTQGGTGAVVSLLQAELFGVRSHALILGVAGTGYTIGASAGPIVAGYLYDITGVYKTAFLTTALVGVAGIVFVSLLKPTTAKRR